MFKDFQIAYCLTMYLLSFRYRDLTNGYLVAEIFSWYFPQDIQMHCYINGKSLESKQKNWDLLNNVSMHSATRYKKNEHFKN